MPIFPKRKLFGITNENPEEIEKRRESLETFLNELFNIEDCLCNEVTRFFL